MPHTEKPLCSDVALCTVQGASRSRWVWQEGGRLRYGTTPSGDRIMDFSMVGYNASYAPPPVVTGVKTLLVRPGSNPGQTVQLIQGAIDTISKSSPGRSGFRGVVQLAPGVFEVPFYTGFTITTGGLVVRGSAKGTLIKMVAAGVPLPNINTRHPFPDVPPLFKVGPAKKPRMPPNKPVRITAQYTPSGTNTLKVERILPSVRAGAEVVVHKPLTHEWGLAMRYDNGNKPKCTGYWNFRCSVESTRSGPCKTDYLEWNRKVIKVDPKALTITLDSSISDNINQTLGTGWVRILSKPRADPITQVGVESISAVGTAVAGQVDNYRYPRAGTFVVLSEGVRNAWVRDVKVVDFTSGADLNGKFLTVKNKAVDFNLISWPKSGAKPGLLTFGRRSSNNLIDSCSSNGTNVFSVVTQSYTTGPNVVTSSDFASPIKPHMYWATGLLVDSCTGAGPQYNNQGCEGGDHGWGIGYSVIWNGNFANRPIRLDRPPTAEHWVIGAIAGKVMCSPNYCKGLGFVDQLNSPVQPQSLFKAQLDERLGRNRGKV